MAGKVNETLWRMVRLRPETVDRLRRLEKSIRTARERGKSRINPNEQDQISLDSLIGELLTRFEQHQERSRKAAQRRRKQEDPNEGEGNPQEDPQG